MPDFLLEIGCEEIPSRMLDDARKDLVDRVSNLVNRERLWVGTSTRPYWSTPRRLALRVEGHFNVQQDIKGRERGPAVNVAFKNGKPTAAAEAFAKKCGVDVSALERETTAKGEYLVATVVKKGRSAAEVLAEALPKEIAAIYWPKNMYWRTGKPERFVRRVRWIVAMIGDQVIPLEFAGIRAGSHTFGHRLWSMAPQSIPNAAQYETVLAGAKVIVDSRQRQEHISNKLDAEAATVSGMRVRKDAKYAELLNTVVNLTEWPSVVLGKFDPQFLSLPEEVLVTVMRDHQKYFAAEDASGKLAPYFLAVLNTEGDPDGLIRHGNERVLRARFNDAQFFWNTDQKIPLTQRVKMLSAVTFQKDLGSYYDKTQRVIRLITNIARALSKAGLEVRGDIAFDAAQFSKADLTTELVKEFTELQGVIGGLYVRAQGLPGHENDEAFVNRVADAVYDQYKPLSMEDSVPRTLEGAVLSIADKADSIAGMFALNLLPSGSKDPFALRRQGNGIVKITAEHRLPLSLTKLMAEARAGYKGSEAEKKFTESGPVYVQTLRLFLLERLQFYLRDVLGLAYDVVNATLAADADDVVDAVARAQAVAKVRPSADFESISTSFKRMKNILRQAAETSKKVAEPFSPAALREEAERHLATAIAPVAEKVNKLRAARNYEPALIEISRLRPDIDLFFDKVMVMVEDESLRANRLGLLQTLVREFSSIADFSEIVTEKK